MGCPTSEDRNRDMARIATNAKKKDAELKHFYKTECTHTLHIWQGEHTATPSRTMTSLYSG
jgi:hypothetical protein